MIISPQDEIDITDAVNVMAGKIEIDMDKYNALYIVHDAVASMAETDTDDDGFGDWISHGSWEACATFDEAWTQIVSAAEQWDELTRDAETYAE